MDFSIIICAHNERKNLRDLVIYLIKSKYRYNLNEILVVSSGSSDGTDELILNYMKKFNTPQKAILKLLTEPKKEGKYSAINLALKSCKKTDVLVFISADVIPARDSINKLVEFFKDPQVGCACGRSIPINRDQSAITQLGVITWRLVNAVIKDTYDKGILKYVASDMMAFKYGVIDNIPKIIHDDGWMSFETHKRGYKVVYEPNCIVYIHVPSTMKDWINQRTRMDRGHYQLMDIGFKPQVLAFMPVKDRLRYIIKDILTEKSLIPMIILVLLELYIKFKSRVESPASEDWQIITSTKDGFRIKS